MFRLGDFVFDESTGDLVRDGKVERLTPQVAAVLTLLLERRGQVVTRVEFRRRLWPDTVVEFDQGLNFCIRQLRLALGDDANNPTYIETLPRRGYRLRPSVDEEPPPARPRSTVSSRGVALVVMLLAIGVTAVVAFRRLRPAVPIVAIVPFDADSTAAGLVGYRDALADVLVEQTTNSLRGRFIVVGPSMTGSFGSRTPIDVIHDRLNASYALSGVVRQRGSATEVFAQVVRARDRAHLWVIRVIDSTSTVAADVLGARIADSLTRLLGPPATARRPLGFDPR